MSTIRKFINLNIKLSMSFERLFNFENSDKKLIEKFLKSFQKDFSIADVGGGKKPAKKLIGINTDGYGVYDGYDISLDELKEARKEYTNIYEIDLTDKSFKAEKKYDRVICMNTLEHVSDTDISIRNLTNMLNDNGILYLKLPCSHAIFSKLNLLLPNEFKKRLLLRVYPSKIGDGFPAFYDKSTPEEITSICKKNHLDILEVNLIKWSSYFTFFFPIYFIWRIAALIQNKFLSDYCESFEIIAIKKKANDKEL